MINIAVCDDEKCMSEKIEKLVEGFFRKKKYKYLCFRVFFGRRIA